MLLDEWNCQRYRQSLKQTPELSLCDYPFVSIDTPAWIIV
jgi:hypothetical protein